MIDYTNLTEQSLSDFVNEAVTTYLKQNNVTRSQAKNLRTHESFFATYGDIKR